MNMAATTPRVEKSSAGSIVQKKPRSQFRGVEKKGKRWRAKFGKTLLGYFDTQKEAAIAYDKKAKMSGRKVKLNFNPVTGQRNVDATSHRGTSTAVVHSSSSGQPPRQETTSRSYDDFDQFQYQGLFDQQQQQGGGGGATSQPRGGSKKPRGR